MIHHAVGWPTIPNVLYTTGADDYVRGSLQLLASYQVADELPDGIVALAELIKELEYATAACSAPILFESVAKEFVAEVAKAFKA